MSISLFGKIELSSNLHMRMIVWTDNNFSVVSPTPYPLHSSHIRFSNLCFEKLEEEKILGNELIDYSSSWD